MEDVLDEVVFSGDLKKSEQAYNEQLHASNVTQKVQLQYAWCLVRSEYPADIRKGNILLEDLFNTHEDTGKRDCLYYLAIGNARIKEFTKALSYVRAFLNIEPGNQQAQNLETLIKKKMEKDDENSVPVLTVVHVDWCVSKNGAAHRTSRYELMNRDDKSILVVRRGQAFFVKLTLSRNYRSKTDGVSLIFTLDGVDEPQYGHGTLVAAPVLEPDEDSEGSSSYHRFHGRESCMDKGKFSCVADVITPAASTIIGKWRMDIDTQMKGTAGAVSFLAEQPLYIIFNPWCKTDTVFLDDEEKLQEYVLADTGLIWRGSHNSLQPSVWKYSQFEKDILECALYVLNFVGKTRIDGRNDPVVISRILSAAVNSSDDNGAVMGNWSGKFGGGSPPTRWIGSQKILEQFYKTKKPVKYGQCWVFAGVLATVCRALGIPNRVVTNFSSGHDRQGSLTIDTFIDNDGNIMKELSSDSYWNFHVWNEVWMQRLDLSPDCNGWQAINATPQEPSEGVFQCGPASVAAVKRGEVQRSYDNKFVFAEVNADWVFWRYNGPSQPLKLIRKETQAIGKMISTKAVGKSECEDITDTYKYPEKSKEERTTMNEALRRNDHRYSNYYLNEEFNEIVFDFELRDDIVIGQPFSVVLMIRNRSETRDFRVSVILKVDTVLYTSTVGDLVKRIAVERLIESGSVEEVRMDVTWKDYGPRLMSQCAFNITCLATVKDIDYEYFAQDDFRVRKPDIKFKILGDVTVGEKFMATATFMNPLPIPLRSGRFLIDGPGLEEQIKLKLTETVEVGGEAKCTFSLIPKWSGVATIAAKFYSKELEDVDGFMDIMVQPAKITNGSSN